MPSNSPFDEEKDEQQRRQEEKTNNKQPPPPSKSSQSQAQQDHHRRTTSAPRSSSQQYASTATSMTTPPTAAASASRSVVKAALSSSSSNATHRSSSRRLSATAAVSTKSASSGGGGSSIEQRINTSQQRSNSNNNNNNHNDNSGSSGADTAAASTAAAPPPPRPRPPAQQPYAQPPPAPRREDFRMHQPHGMSAIGPSASSVSSAVSSSMAYQQSPHLQLQNQQQMVSMESPLPPVVQRGLGDRSNEKRKNAALEIEALIKSLQEANNMGMVGSVIGVLSKDFCTSMNSNYRKGGLVGLAATAIGLMQNARNFLHVLLPPVLHCFDDPESRVRFYACESLYNIAKVSRQAVLDQYFGQIWEGLTKLFADVDVDVKNGANLLDRLIKDIVTEADNFHVDQFLPLLQAYIRRTNPYIRQLIVGWITLLDSIPDINMLDFLPEFLDGLLNMLSDSNREIRQAADAALSEFLRELAVSNVVELGPIILILVAQSQSAQRLNRLTAISWLAELIHHPYSGGDNLLPFHAQMLGAILFCISDEEKEIRLVAERTNDDLLELVKKTNSIFELKSLLTTLTNELLHKEDVPTKLAALRWINMLMEKRKKDMNEFTEDLLPVLLRTLSDPSDTVVLLDLQVLSRISMAQRDKLGYAEEREEVQFRLVLNAILNLFAQDRQLLETRGSLIIRKLCVLLNAKSVYIRMADTLSSYGDKAAGRSTPADALSGAAGPDLGTLQFVATMVQTLNLILLTASELHDLRTTLAKSFQKDAQDGRKVFVTLFHCWCHNPIATFSLCLLAQAYDLSFALVKRFSDMSDVTVGFLMQIDKLVQLLESPIFVHLRLQLLEVEAPHHAPLLKSIYGLLMCLPQGDAFRLLNDRLTAVCNLRDNLGVSGHGNQLGSGGGSSSSAAVGLSGGTADNSNEASIVGKTGLSLEKLLDRFDEVSEQYRQATVQAQRAELKAEQLRATGPNGEQTDASGNAFANSLPGGHRSGRHNVGTPVGVSSSSSPATPQQQQQQPQPPQAQPSTAANHAVMPSSRATRLALRRHQQSQQGAHSQAASTGGQGMPPAAQASLTSQRKSNSVPSNRE